MNKVELEEIAREAGVEAFELIPDTPQGRERFINQIASIVKKALIRVTENAEKIAESETRAKHFESNYERQSLLNVDLSRQLAVMKEALEKIVAIGNKTAGAIRITDQDAIMEIANSALSNLPAVTENAEKIEQEEVRRIRHLNRLATWAQQDPTQPIPFGVREWVLGSKEWEELDWQPSYIQMRVRLKKMNVNACKTLRALEEKDIDAAIAYVQEVRKPSVVPIDPDPDGQMGRFIRSIDAGLQKELLCVHIEGPDEIEADPSLEAAIKRASELNAYFATFEKTEHSPELHARVQAWPYDAEDHANELPKKSK